MSESAVMQYTPMLMVQANLRADQSIRALRAAQTDFHAAFKASQAREAYIATCAGWQLTSAVFDLDADLIEASQVLAKARAERAESSRHWRIVSDMQPHKRPLG